MARACGDDLLSTGSRGGPRPTSFEEGCLQQERPCPQVNFTRSAWYNARKGPKSAEALAKHIECCHAIKRSQRSWARPGAKDSGHAGWQLVLQVLRLRAAALRSFG
ncbi:unnamed protein product [Effrenium voratum]|nr:unnamed protein product [Effrenium voratum]